MKRAIAFILAFAFVLALIPATALAAPYTLTMGDANASATYGATGIENTIAAGGAASVEEGNTVVLTAANVTGKKFVKWSVTAGTCAAVADKTSAKLTFTMPAADFTATPVYKDLYKVTLTGGTATVSGKAVTSPFYVDEGELVVITETVSKDAVKKTFLNWYVSTGTLAAVHNQTATVISFYMPAMELGIEAQYRNQSLITVSGVSVTRNGSAVTLDASGQFYADVNDVIKVTAAPGTGKAFTDWTYDAATPVSCQVTAEQSKSPSYSFKVPTYDAADKIVITANSEQAYLLTVMGTGTSITGGTVNSVGNYEKQVASGATATITAAAPGDGKFLKWEKVGDPQSATTTYATTTPATVTMPASDLTLQATYGYPVSLTNSAGAVMTLGTTASAAGVVTITDYFATGTVVTIKAEATVGSYTFQNWRVVSGDAPSSAIANLTSPSTTFTVPTGTKAIVLEAVYTMPVVIYKKNLNPNTNWIYENVASGGTTTITADARGTDGYGTDNFVGWKVEPTSFLDYTVNNTARTLTITKMPNYDVTCTPIYEYEFEIKNGTFTVNGNGTQLSGKQKVRTGDKVTITPHESATEVFSKWISLSSRITGQATTKILSFYMPAADLSAYPEYRVAHLTIYGARGEVLYPDASGKLSSSGKCPGCSAGGHTWCDVPGTFKTFTIPDATGGRTFNGYTASAGLQYTVGTDSHQVTVQMPAGDATLTLNYGPIGNYYPYTGAYIKLKTEPQRYYSQLEYFYGTGLEVYYYEEGRDDGVIVDNADLRFSIVKAGTDTAVASGTTAGFSMPEVGEFDLLITFYIDGYQMAPTLRCMSDASNHIVVLDKRAQFVSIEKAPLNNVYYYGETVDKDGMRVFLKYADHVSGALQYFSLRELASSEYSVTLWNNTTHKSDVNVTTCLPKVLDSDFDSLLALAQAEPDRCKAYNSAGAAYTVTELQATPTPDIAYFRVALAIYFVDNTQVDTTGKSTQMECVDSNEPVWVTFKSGATNLAVDTATDAPATIDQEGDYAGTATNPMPYHWWQMNLSTKQYNRTVEVELKLDGTTIDPSSSKAELEKAAAAFYYTNEDASVAYLTATSNPLIFNVTPKSRGVTTVKFYLRGQSGEMAAIELTVVLPGEDPVGPDSMALNLSEATMFVGSKVTLYADSYSPSSANTTCKWTVAFADAATTGDLDNADEYVSVDPNGVVTVLKYTHRPILVTGTAVYPKKSASTPPAAADYASDSCEITIVSVPADGITISETALTMYRLSSFQLTAKLQPADVSDLKINWTSSDSTIVSVDADGRMTANKVGTATITATANSNPNISAKCVITVKEGVLVTGLTISKQSLSLAVSESSTLTVSYAPDTATTKTVNWTSSNTGIATVDANGKIRAVSEGSVVITATATDGSGIFKQCIVNVSKLVVSAIVLNKQQLAIIEDNSEQLTATVYPTNASLQSVTWSSSNEKVARVDSDGTVTGVSGGACYITATAKDGTGKYVDCVVVVTAKIPVTGLMLNVSSFNMLKNDTTQLVCSVTPANATYTAITWTSSYPQYATVSDKGLVTSLADGETTITATAGGKSISIKVNVTSTEYSYGTVVKCSRRVNVRKSASGTSGSIGYAYLGDTYKILGKTGSWYKIQYNATTEAYIWSYYLQAIATTSGYVSAGKPAGATPAPGTTATPTVTTKSVTIVNCTTAVNVRSTPDSTITTNKLGLAYKDEVFLYNSLTNGWYEIIYTNGVKAYVNASFCQANG